MIEETIVPDRRLGRLPAKSSRKALQFSDYLKFFKLPSSTIGFWRSRKPFALRTYGNTSHGDCTRASQAHMIVRMERLETNGRGGDVQITDEEVIRVYREMCIRRYGSDADNGAYETDALDDWRNPDTTIKDTKGRPFTIDAYMRINPFNHDEVKAGLALSGAKGIKVCLNLPAAFQNIDPPQPWHIPEGQPPIGPWQAGSWGGHSMTAVGYDQKGIYLADTWGTEDRLLTWEAAAVFLDEAHFIMDSMNYWRKKASVKNGLKLSDVVADVNAVSSIKIT